MKRSKKEWLGLPEYVGLTILSDHEAWCYRMWPTELTYIEFQRFLSFCKVEWSFSKL